jgi:hypothetical protein
LFLAAAWYGRYRLAAKWENLSPVLLTLPALFAGTSGRGWRAAPRILFVAGLAAWAGLGLGIGVYQTTAPYSTTYDYGLSGAQDAAAFLRHNTSPTEMFGAMKDLGYLTRRRYYDNYPGLFGGPEATRRFIETMAAGKMKYVVFTTRGQDRLFLNPALEAWVKEHCALAASFGDYRIYTFNPTPAGAQSGAAPGAVK